MRHRWTDVLRTRGLALIILVVYGLLIAGAVVGAYFLIRGAVLSALKAHSRAVDDGRP